MRGFFRSRSLRRLSLRRKARRCPSRATIISTAPTRSAGNGRGRAPGCASNPRWVTCRKIPIPGRPPFRPSCSGVYAPKALDGKLRFEFRKEGRTCAWFDYGLEFTGWQRGMGGFRPRHAGPARGGDGRTGRHGGGRRTGRVVFRPPDSLLVSGRAAPYGRFPGAVHQRRDHEPLAHAAAIVAQSDARTPRRGR